MMVSVSFTDPWFRRIFDLKRHYGNINSVKDLEHIIMDDPQEL